MSLAWTIDTENHLMVAVADGEVTRVDVENYLDAIIAALPAAPPEQPEELGPRRVA
jgi:hypothetical protein